MPMNMRHFLIFFNHPFFMKTTKNLGGRPSSVTPEKVSKLEQAFSIGASVKEARNYAKISRSSYYRFITDNPEFRERFEDLQTTPILKALESVYSDLDNVETAKWLLERRRKDEYSTRQELGGEVKINLWQQFIRKAAEDAPRYLKSPVTGSDKA